MSPTALAESGRTRPEPSPDPQPESEPWDAEPLEAEPSLDGLCCSERDYWIHYYHVPDAQYEWNNGRLEEIPASNYGTFQVYHWFMLLLDQYLLARPIAKLVGVIHSRVLPGFRFRVADLGRRPPHEELRTDPVYAVTRSRSPNP